MSTTLHVALAAQQMHEAAKYYPMTAKDADTAKDAGIFAGIVVGVIALIQIVSSGGRKPAASR